MIFLKKKRRLLNLLKTTVQMIDLIKSKNQSEVINNCQEAVKTIAASLEGELAESETVFNDLQTMYDLLTLIDQQQVDLTSKLIFKMKQLLVLIVDKLDKLIPVKLNIAFMPYKITMWDSLASIYEAAKQDPDCTAKVIPIPYYEIAADKTTSVYEGDLFPNDIPIVPYDEYNLAKEEPDIIFIHNAYDQYNDFTQVNKRFFTANLKQYTDMLVYVPYHITGFGKLIGDAQYITYAISTMENIDKIVVAGQFVKDAAVKYGIPKEKVLVLGSPKMDAVYQATKSGKRIPPKWQKQLKGKFVFALDTNCMYWVNHQFNGFAYVEQVFDAARMIPNCAVIWRPHPLSRISIAHYVPQMLKQYDGLLEKIKNNSNEYPNVVLDESSEYLSFLNASDAYISEANSLSALYTVTERPIIFNAGRLKDRLWLDENCFYRFYDQSYPWYKIAKNLANGKDPKKKLRRNLTSQIYSYTDGTSGKTIYQEIKKEITLKVAGEFK
ncbi:MAG: CDP-glycerol glycerophosphotransferase family protein [Liquorilactobacillus ghanensis]|uniref:CDP-glycerol glycerophosphotransferase family protein n=1 Tax=Liquorilactobacillus ghanensis TaxID=399370 RepID=UPI0039EB8419